MEIPERVERELEEIGIVAQPSQEWDAVIFVGLSGKLRIETRDIANQGWERTMRTVRSVFAKLEEK